MSTDNDDKTVFDPKGGGGGGDANATMFIPNPGRRLRSESEAPAQSATPASPAGMSASDSGAIPVGLQQPIGGQDNVFLTAANKLITVLSALSNSMSHPNIAQLQQELATEIGNFDHALKQAGVRNEEALTARYVLCASIDEAVMDTPWGAETGWGERSLLRVYHDETSGGVRFFDLLDQLMGNAAQYRNLIELFYVLLCLGFRGKYQLDKSGDAQLDNLRERVYQDLHGGRSVPRALSVGDSRAEALRPTLRSQIPLWVVLCIVLALTLLIYTGLRAWMYTGTVDAVDSFERIYPTAESP